MPVPSFAHAAFSRGWILGIGAMLLVACAGQPPRPTTVAPSGDGLASTTISEAFVSVDVPEVEVDSLTTWLSPEGQTRVIVSGKHGGTLLVFDGETGELLREVGERGTLEYPNGVATFGDWLFVVERDAASVSIFELPDFILRGRVGEGVLKTPYGLWLQETAPGEVELLVTDSYVLEGGDLSPEQLGERIKRFRVRLDDDPIRSFTLDAFGGTDDESALRWVESIVGDPALDRLVIAEEHPDFRQRGALIYDLAGNYTGVHLGEGLYAGDMEGIALYECQSGNGYWITTDQGWEINRFHVFDRVTLAYLGSFSGEVTRNTDGIALHPGSSERFPYGVLYVANADLGIAAFDWRDIAAALNLWLDCPE